MKVREILTDESKWVQGHRTLGEKHCLLEAVFNCYPNTEAYAIMDRLRVCLCSKGWRGSVVGWNDDPSRKFKHVRSLIEELDI